jgi:hypothetical protein
MTNLLLQKVILFCSIFLISFFLFSFFYKYVDKNTNKNVFYVCLTKIYRYVTKLNLFELFFIIFIVLIILNFLFYLTVVFSLQMLNLSQFIMPELFENNLGYLFFENIDGNISGFNFDNIMSTTEENIINTTSNATPSTSNPSITTPSTPTPSTPTPSTSTPSTSTPSTYSTANAVKFGADAIAAAGAMKLANNVVKASPTVATKAVAAVAGIALGGGAILFTNTVSKFSDNTKNTFISDIDWYGILSEAFNLTGNSALDLLAMLVFFKKMEVLFLYILTYNLIVISIDTEYVSKNIESYFNKYPKLNYYIIKYLNYTKKSSRVIIISCILLLIFSNYYSFFAVNFLFDNFDNIVDYYLKNKN